MKVLIQKLEKEHILSKEEFIALLEGRDEALAEYLFERARAVRHRIYGKDVFIRGLIEFSNYCKNDCYYCGIRCSNKAADRYRLSEETILGCCEKGYRLGYRTFVLQGGEDPYYNAERMERLIRTIKGNFPDCALTLSAGEHPLETYRLWKEAGADRYLLRHETADEDHYRALHPERLTLAHRKECLYNLKKLGYQVGCGFMVGSPKQTMETIAKDLLFIHELQPQMVGIGPFIPHRDTPFAKEPQGELELTLFLLGIVRLMLPTVLLPATTALGSIHPEGRERGILAGANVCMPNLSPKDVRDKYLLYNNKLSTGSEDALQKSKLAKQMERIGYRVVVARGDPEKENQNV